MLNVSVILGSIRSGRQGIKAARFIIKKLEEKGHKVNFVDPVEYNLPIIDKRYSDYKEGEKVPSNLKKLHELFVKSDAFILVSAEYNHGVPPALKNIVDHFHKAEFAHKPAGVITYSQGGFGGVRAGVQWRAILSELQLISTPNMMPIPKIQEAFDEDGNPLDEAYNKRAGKFLEELEWFAYALKNHREKEIGS